jgi:hypothetical protein
MQTAQQVLNSVVPAVQWRGPLNRNSSRSSTLSAYPRFPTNVIEWRNFLDNADRCPYPQGTCRRREPITDTLRTERQAEDHFVFNLLIPVKDLLPQGSSFETDCDGFFGRPDRILCHNLQAKMPIEMKTRHNLNLTNHDFWDVWQRQDCRRARLEDRILSQVYGAMACNGLHYAILSSYSDTWFLYRPEGTVLRISPVVRPTDNGPTLRKCVYYICRLALQDNVGPTFSSDPDDNYTSDSEISGSSSSENDDNDSNGEYRPSEKQKKFPLSLKQRAPSQRGIVKVDNYINSGTFGKVFSGKYNDHAVAWKTCDAYKEEEKIAALKNEAHIYTILEDCQGIITCLFLFH